MAAHSDNRVPCVEQQPNDTGNDGDREGQEAAQHYAQDDARGHVEEQIPVDHAGYLRASSATRPANFF